MEGDLAGENSGVGKCRDRRAWVGLVQLLVREARNHSDLKKVEVYFHTEEIRRWEIQCHTHSSKSLISCVFFLAHSL